MELLKSLQGVCLIRGTPCFLTSCFRSHNQLLCLLCLLCLPFFPFFSCFFFSFFTIPEQKNPGPLPLPSSPLPTKHTFPPILIHLQAWEIPRQGALPCLYLCNPGKKTPPPTPTPPAPSSIFTPSRRPSLSFIHPPPLSAFSPYLG